MAMKIEKVRLLIRMAALNPAMTFAKSSGLFPAANPMYFRTTILGILPDSCAMRELNPTFNAGHVFGLNFLRS